MFCLYPTQRLLLRFYRYSSCGAGAGYRYQLRNRSRKDVWFHNCSFFSNELFLDFVAKLLMRNSPGKKFMVFVHFLYYDRVSVPILLKMMQLLF
jgi:hypothetical protein